MEVLSCRSRYGEPTFFSLNVTFWSSLNMQHNLYTTSLSIVTSRGSKPYAPNIVSSFHGWLLQYPQRVRTYYRNVQLASTNILQKSISVFLRHTAGHCNRTVCQASPMWVGDYIYLFHHDVILYRYREIWLLNIHKSTVHT